MVQLLPTIRPLAERFDGFIIDLWGVLHDGVKPYPGALEALRFLHDAGKKTILLSNAPRRNWKAEAVLTELGFDRALYDFIFTSGEATYEYLASKHSAQHTAHSTPYIYIGPHKDEDLLEGLPYRIVEDPTEAAFALVTGFDGPGMGFDTKQEQIDACLKAKLHLYNANPDKLVIPQDGARWLCSGVIAEYYEQRGGKVTSFGKPLPAVYAHCLQQLALPAKHICAIGDTLETDIAGANQQGIFSVLTAGGVLRERLGVNFGAMPESKTLEAIFLEENQTPSAVIPAFIV